jgi:hypothetical protein
MTQNKAGISASMTAVSSLLNTSLAKVSGSALGQAVIPYLDGTSGAYEDLIGGNGSFTDEQTIVVALSNAVAAALRVCGPSPAVQYAPAQEVARDQMRSLPAGSYTYTGTTDPNVDQMQSTLGQEQQLQALGPQGDGGSCTIARQMYDAANEVLGSESGLEQDISGDDFGSRADEQDAEALQVTISQITSQGLVPPSGSSEAVTAAEQRVSESVTWMNNQISEANTLADQAYAMANAMAAIPAPDTDQNGAYFGTCKPAGWPLQPPPPIQDISQ